MGCPNYIVLRVLGRSKKIDEQFECFKSHGDFSVWPFIRETDYFKFRSSDLDCVFGGHRGEAQKVTEAPDPN